MSKHVKRLRALEASHGLLKRGYGLEWVDIEAAADALELAERQNRVMRQCLKYIVEQSARPGCQTGATPYDAAEQALIQCSNLSRKAAK